MVLQISVLFGGVVSLLLLLISCGCFPFLTFIKLTVHVLRRILRRREKTEAPIEKRMTALITGAASGFGLEIAKLFARDGYDLVLVAKQGNLLEEVKSKLYIPGKQIYTIAKDMCREGAAQELVDQIHSQSIEIDFLVNASGFGAHENLSEEGSDVINSMLKANITNMTLLTRHLVADMLERNFGKILNVSSLAGTIPGPGMSVYYASKAYIISFSQALAYELRRSNVTCTVVCPGAIESFHGGKVKLYGMFGKVNVPLAAFEGYKAMFRGEKICFPGFRNWVVGKLLVPILPAPMLILLGDWMNRYVGE